MDIDLTAGLTKLKTTTPEPAVLGAATPPEEAFTSILDIKKPAPPSPVEGDVLPVLPWPLPLALPQEPVQAATEPTADVIKASQNIETLPIEALPQHAKAETLPVVPLLQQVKAADVQEPKALPLAPLPVATLPTEKPLKQKVDAPEPHAKVASNMPALIPARTSTTSEAQPRPLPSTGHLNTLDAPDMANLPLDKPTEAKVPDTLTKAPMGPTTQPAIGVAAVDTPPPLLSDMPFGLKIDSQPLEAAKGLQPAPAPAPVANQISDQLPHLLNKAEKQTVELRLDPPELGRVTIHLTTHDQQVSAHVMADRVDTVDLMRRHAELLTATLARAGFSQADLTFQQGKSQNQQSGFQHYQGLTDTFDGQDKALPAAPTATGLDGRLDIRL